MIQPTNMLTNARPLVMAHQGLAVPGAYPRETLGAFRAAVDSGADALELDVQRTRDGQLVIHHDNKLGDGRTISDTIAAELNPPGTPADLGIPTLRSVLDLARASGTHAMVEIKGNGFERAVVDETSSILPLDQFTVMAFSGPVVRAVERYRPEVNTAVIGPRLVPPALRESAIWPALWGVLDRFDWSLGRVAKAGADALVIHEDLVTDRMLASAAKRGIDVNVWTVDDDASIQRFAADPRIHGVITNRSDAVLDVQRGAGLIGRPTS